MKREKGVVEETFFEQTQKTFVKWTVYMLKRLYGDAVTLEMVRDSIRDPDSLNALIDAYGERIGEDDCYRFFRGNSNCVPNQMDRYVSVSNLLNAAE